MPTQFSNQFKNYRFLRGHTDFSFESSSKMQLPAFKSNPFYFDSLPAWILILYRELAEYFYTPIAYIFLIIFLVLNSVCTFYLGSYFEREQADLVQFFIFHPWLFLILAPALGMRLWAEERKTGTIQTLLTLPTSIVSAVSGKFLASWVFMTFALALTVPIWISVNYLGNPDNGVIIASYLGSWLLAGSYLAVSSCMSALTQNQVIAFILAVVINFVFTLGGLFLIENILSGFLPFLLIETIVSLNYLTHFNEFVKGVVSLPAVVFFVSMTVLFLFLNVVAVQVRNNR